MLKACRRRAVTFGKRVPGIADWDELERGTESVAHGKAWGDARLKDYTANHYHKPSDEYSPDWNLAGAAQEVMLLYLMGSELADNRDFPAWREGVEFRAIREASLARGR